MKLPRVRSRPTSSAASVAAGVSWTGSAQAGVGGGATGTGVGSSMVIADGGSASNGSSGSVVGSGSTGVPSSGDAEVGGVRLPVGIDQRRIDRFVDLGRGRFVVTASPEGHRRSLPGQPPTGPDRGPRAPGPRRAGG